MKNNDDKSIQDVKYHPLITFVLLTYNQENYVREAIEGAFSQTYSPLEIIISDDCSSDRTFDIIQETIKSYKGPHKVTAIKTTKNMGVTQHFLLRGKQASGEIIVAAAGDDISKPERCEKHFNNYNNKEVMAVTGAYDLIDNKGFLISKKNHGTIVKGAYKFQIKLFKRLNYPYVVIQGSTASYRSEVFRFELPESDLVLSEDNLLNIIIYMNGYHVNYIQDSLVLYRSHSNAISNTPLGKETIQSREIKEIDYALRLINTLTWLVNKFSIHKNERMNIKNIKEIKRQYKDISEWSEYSLSTRCISLLKSILEADKKMLKWKCARIKGKAPNYQPLLIVKEKIKHLKKHTPHRNFN